MTTAIGRVQTRNWIEERGIFSVLFEEIGPYDEGGTDFAIYYKLPTGGADAVATGLGRCHIEVMPHSRNLVWEFYAAQTAGNLTGHRLIKNRKTKPEAKGVINMSPTQVKLAQLQRGDTKRIYLGILRVGYTPPVNTYSLGADTPIVPCGADTAFELNFRIEIKQTGNVQRHMATEAWQIRSYGKNTTASDNMLGMYSTKINFDGAYLLNATDVKVPVYRDEEGATHFALGKNCCVLSTDDTDNVYEGLTFAEWCSYNKGRFFQLEHPVHVQGNDADGDLADDTQTFMNIIIGQDGDGIMRAVLFNIDQTSGKVYTGHTLHEGRTPFGRSQITVRRGVLQQAQAGGPFMMMNVDENYDNVIDRCLMRPNSNKKRHKRGQRALKRKETQHERVMPESTAMSRMITPRHPIFSKAEGAYDSEESWTQPATYQYWVYDTYSWGKNNPGKLRLKPIWKKIARVFTKILFAVLEDVA